MKKLLLLSISFFMAVASFGAFQFKLESIGTHYPMATGPYGVDFKLVVTEGSGTIYISDIMTQSPQFTNYVDVANNKYGTVNLSNGVKNVGNSAQTVTLNNGVTAYELGRFTAGDEVGIYMYNQNGSLASSVFGRDYVGDPFNYRGNESDFIGRLGFTDGDTIRFMVSGVEGGGIPSGQPLPGAFAVLLISGGVLAVRKFRRG